MNTSKASESLLNSSPEVAVLSTINAGRSSTDNYYSHLDTVYEQQLKQRKKQSNDMEGPEDFNERVLFWSILFVYVLTSSAVHLITKTIYQLLPG